MLLWNRIFWRASFHRQQHLISLAARFEHHHDISDSLLAPSTASHNRGCSVTAFVLPLFRSSYLKTASSVFILTRVNIVESCRRISIYICGIWVNWFKHQSGNVYLPYSERSKLGEVLDSDVFKLVPKVALGEVWLKTAQLLLGKYQVEVST